jgi:hypothetical protein
MIFNLSFDIFRRLFDDTAQSTLQNGSIIPGEENQQNVSTKKE